MYIYIYTYFHIYIYVYIYIHQSSPNRWKSKSLLIQWLFTVPSIYPSVVVHIKTTTFFMKQSHRTSFAHQWFMLPEKHLHREWEKQSSQRWCAFPKTVWHNRIKAGSFTWLRLTEGVFKFKEAWQEFSKTCVGWHYDDACRCAFCSFLPCIAWRCQSDGLGNM